MGKRAAGEGTIFQRKDGRWVAQANFGWVGGRRSRPTYGRSQAEVRAKLEAAKRAMVEGRPATDSRDRLDAFLSYWLNEVIDPSTRAPATKAGYRHIIARHIVPSLGHVRLADVRPRDVQAVLNVMRAEGFSNRTRQYVHAVLRLALSHAETWGLIGKNPAKVVQAPRPKRDAERVHALDIEDARRYAGQPASPPSVCTTSATPRRRSCSVMGEPTSRWSRTRSGTPPSLSPLIFTSMESRR